MNALALNKLYEYIQSLNLSKRDSKWLAGKILECSESKKSKALDPEIEKIPEEYRCDPYEISPSGDPFFADKRNVERLDKILNDKEAMKVSGKPLKTREDIERFLELL